MSEEKTTRELVYEVSRDVKWICKTLAEMKEQAGDHENRLRAIEGWRQTKIGEEQRLSKISAGAGGLVGGVVAVMVRALGGGW
ncbi:hypothetical protein ABH15_07510 [Methanoculleus taiwanensis]|uniref:Uncharacterized protein n=1 Tax=Methanoculleus taiwanensis TaxID=1550565 RepID=A0A498H115_9EURY|nr:hypothetical protein [Methanoculleus taiwanensis]RXE56034.1 hypothetical protein ABH15_07510 [Methanoculleus taiwanensis]